MDLGRRWSSAARQVKKMLDEVFPVMKGAVLTFISLTSEPDVKKFERSLLGSA